MKEAVRNAVAPYNEKWEGLVLSMYADWESLITTSIGCLIDSTPAPGAWAPAMGLPWRHPANASGKPAGLLATQAEVVAEWKRVKAGTCGAKRLLKRSDCPRVQAGKVCYAHDGWRASEIPSALRLLRADAEALVQQRAAGMWSILVKRFPTLVTAPADAQLGVLSWSWAMGANRTGWPKFFAAIKAGDWMTCAKESAISTKGNAGVIPRNQAQVVLFTNAAKSPDPDTLYWPRAL
jgi:GH24 family phage-related lysozyme (muramidase)